MTDNTNAGVLYDAVRAFSSFLDRGVYGLLNIVYQVFFNITSVDLFQNEMMMKFYGRIQLILGVFMMFQLAMTILKGIVDPNSFTDSKSGVGNLVYRVAVSLILLTVLVPISTPGRNEFEKRVNNNGILFGTLYSLQYRILNNNTIGKLVLGTTSDNSSMVSTGNQKNDVEYSSRVFTATILRSFYRINLIEESKRTHVDGKEDEMLNANRMCQDIDDATLAAYTKVDAEAGDIVSYVNETCSVSGGIAGAVGLGQKRYQFYYMAFVCPIIGIIFVVVFLNFCVEIAIRSVKLAVLRLIAPIPIISYMDPKGGKDNAFSSWVKTLTSTYLDLFIRLAAVYFVLFVIQDMLYSGIRINTSGGMVGAISLIMIWLGLFIFAKQAPKFIKQAIGLKEDAGGGFFSGLGGLAVGFGAIGSTISGARASWMADSANGNSHANPLNLAKNAVSGIAGGVLGANAAIDAMNSAKGNTWKAASDAFKSRNSHILGLGRDGGTFFGALGSEASSLFSGESPYDRLDADFKRREQLIKDSELLLKSNQDNNARRKSIMDRAKSKAVDNIQTSGTYNGITGNYRDYHSVYTAAMQNGDGVLTDAATGQKYFEYRGQRVLLSQAQSIDVGLLDENTANYYEQVVAGTIDDNSITEDRRAYREATGNDLEAVYGGANGLKASYGNYANINKAESDRINRERLQLNNEKQGNHAQRSQANANRFKSGGNSK